MTAFAHYLPYWTTRTVDVGGERVGVFVMVDGTICLGFESPGLDLFAADNGKLNGQKRRVANALNSLDKDAYLQVEWTTGGSWDEAIQGYAKRGTGALPLLAKQRQERATMFLQDASLRRGRLVYFIGLRKVLPLGANAAATGALAALRRLFQSGGTDELTEDFFVQQVVRLASNAQRFWSLASSLGMRFQSLSEEDLVAEAYRTLNPITSKKLSCEVADDSTPFSPSELQGEWEYMKPASLRQQLPLGDLAWEETFLTVDDPALLTRVLSLQRLPQFTTPDFSMGVQFATPSAFRMVTTFCATDAERMNDKFTKKRDTMQGMSGGGFTRNVGASIALAEYEEVLDQMLANDQRIFEVNTSVIVSGTSHTELDRVTDEMKDGFRSINAALTTETARQMHGFLGTLPANGYMAPTRLSVLTDNAADLVPWFAPRAGDEQAQFLYHTRQETLHTTSFGRERKNQNVLVFGGSGAGKSFHVANVFEQACLDEGGPVIIVDVQGEAVSNYKVLAELFGGSYTPMFSSQDIAFNPFYPHDELLVVGTDPTGKQKARLDDKKVGFMRSLVAMMAISDYAERREKPLIEQIARDAVLAAYKETRQKKRTPLLRDVVTALDCYAAPQPEYKPIAREMFLGLETWTKDPSRARLLDRPSRFAGNSRFLVFDFHGLERDPELATVLLLSVSFYIWSVIEKLPLETIKFVIFDETWKLLSHPTAADIIAELYRTGRKWGASSWAITQNIRDFTDGPVADALMANSEQIFLNVHAGDHAFVGDLCGLGPRARDLFQSLSMKKGEYSELLHIVRKEAGAEETTVVRLKPTPFDLWLNTTDAADVGFRNRLMAEKDLSLVDAIAYAAEHYPNGAPKEQR